MTKRWIAATLAGTAVLLGVGCATLDERQREWIFQPSDATWGRGAELAQGMQPQWIDFESEVTHGPARLHALWAANTDRADAPVLLYLHGARWNVESAAPRIRRLQAMGFSVLAIDRQELAGPALGGDGRRGRPRGLGLARGALPAAAALHLRPLAGRRDRDRPGRTGGRRARHHRRGDLHLVSCPVNICAFAAPYRAAG